MLRLARLFEASRHGNSHRGVDIFIHTDRYNRLLYQHGMVIAAVSTQTGACIMGRCRGQAPLGDCHAILRTDIQRLLTEVLGDVRQPTSGTVGLAEMARPAPPRCCAD